MALRAENAPPQGGAFFVFSPAGHGTPSVKAYGFATFPKGTASGGKGKLCGSA